MACKPESCNECSDLLLQLNALKEELKQAEQNIETLQQDNKFLSSHFGDKAIDDKSLTNNSEYDLGENAKALQFAQGLEQPPSPPPLPDARQFQRLVPALLEAALVHKQAVAILLCSFKGATDTGLGSKFEVNPENLAALLNAASHKPDLVFQTGLHEFALLLETDLEGNMAAQTAERVIRELNNSSFGPAKGNELLCHIGIALYPGDAQDLQGLQRFADRALYSAEKVSDSYYEFYRSYLATASPLRHHPPLRLF